jgi:predicted nucleic acid-binding protein
MKGDKIFIDTNILVYGHDVDAGQKHQIARSTLVELWEQRTGVMSVQVLQEFYVTMTRKVLRPLPPNKVRNIIQDYFSWHIEMNDPLSVLVASRIEENYRISFWDALIVTAASKANVSKILTEDLQAGRLIEGILIENPFLQGD